MNISNDLSCSQVREIYEKYLDQKDVDVTLCYIQVSVSIDLCTQKLIFSSVDKTSSAIMDTH